MFRRWRQSAAPEHFNRAMAKIGDDGLKILKKHTPVRSGRLRNSMTILTRTTASGSIDLRSGIKLGTNLHYGRFVDQGTKASSGRYVPALGRKITTGTHPGVRARNFIQAAKIPIEERAKMIIEDFEKAWRKSLRV